MIDIIFTNDVHSLFNTLNGVMTLMCGLRRV